MDTLTQTFNELRKQDIKTQAAWLAQLCYHIGGDEGANVWWQFYKLLQSIHYMDDNKMKSPNAQRFIDEARSRIKVTILYNPDFTQSAANYCSRQFIRNKF